MSKGLYYQEAQELVHRLLDAEQDAFDPKADLDREIPDLMRYATKAARKPWGYMLKSTTVHEVGGKKYPTSAPWLNVRRGQFTRWIGDGTVYRRPSTTAQWPHLESVPIYGDPRKYGEKVLDPNFVEPPSRHPRQESLDDEIRDLRAYAMKHGEPPHIKITFHRTTPESAEQGDYSESGWEDEEGVLMQPDEIDVEEGKTCVDLAVEFLQREGATETSSVPFSPGDWYSTGWSTIDYGTGEQEERNFHLYGFTPEQEQEIYQKLRQRR